MRGMHPHRYICIHTSMCLLPFDSLPEEKAEELARGGPNIHSLILDASREGSLETLERLVTPDTVNCQDMEGRKSTPLHFAAGYNRKEVVEFLLEQKADVGKKDKG